MNGKRILFLAFPMIIAALMVGFHYHSLPGSDWLQDKGIVPRTMQGLWGLIGVHFIHGNNTHLWANVPNLIFLMYITIAYFPSIAKYIFIYTFIITPILMWLFCRGGVMHIGASAWIYAIFGFLFFTGIFAKNPRVRAVTLFVGFAFSGMFWGILPYQKGVSWDGHLCGLIAGVLTALFLKGNVALLFPIVAKEWQNELDEDYPDYYAQFDKSKD
jgi:membrane associated rhomboid family serine protease